MANAGDNSQGQAIFDRAVNREREKREAAEDLKDIYTEANDKGFDPDEMKIAVSLFLEDEKKRLLRERREEKRRNAEQLLMDFGRTP